MGIPMANALFAGSTLGFVVLPMIVYHQMQFMACAARPRRRYGAAGVEGRSGRKE
jgi:sodium/bile acid cotransporter 7